MPSLGNPLCTLQSLGPDARLFNVYITHEFRHALTDTADVIHLGIKCDNKYNIDKNLAFGEVHGTAFFESITNFIRFFFAKRGFQVWNYIDDICTYCHKDSTQELFET